MSQTGRRANERLHAHIRAHNERNKSDMATTEEIFRIRLANRESIPGARVGDYIRLPRVHRQHPEFTRITHDWGDTLQTGGHNGSSSYLCESGHISYSGSLDSGVIRADLIPTNETRMGMVWVFKDGIAGAGRGVDREAPMRVFNLRAGADVSGLGELRSPYWLCCLNKDQHLRTCGYWYTITKHGMSHTAFATRDELDGWLLRTGVVLGADLPAERGTHANIPLHYADDIRLVKKGGHYVISK
jgi:hypothetical protein